MVDDIVKSGIEKGRRIAKKFASDLHLEMVSDKAFGRQGLKQRKVLLC